MASGLSVKCPLCKVPAYKPCVRQDHKFGSHPERIQFENDQNLESTESSVLKDAPSVARKTTRLPESKSLAGKHTAIFILEKETPGAFRYKEIDNTGKQIDMYKDKSYLMGSLYIRRVRIGNNPPKYVKVTVETSEGDS